jgi:anti-sigma factor RsiW
MPIDGTEDLACRELVELVTDYLEGALPEPERARFDAHLGLCDGCHTYVDQMRQTIRLTGALRVEDVAPEAEAALLRVFRDWKRGA